MVTTTAQTILIIDDNEDDILLTELVLSRIAPQFRRVIAHKGERGLALLRDGRPLPAMILLDLKMPGMSGFDVLREIRADSRLQHIPVIVVTSSALEADEKEACSAGATSFLHKSFDMDQFSRNIESLLKRCLKD
jgi:CheY-like chemotaxis protein